jgi:uncharacterized membrane protein
MAPGIRLTLTWLATMAVFLTLDAFWLGLFSGSLYTEVLGDLLLDSFRIAPAVAFYALHVTGIAVFVLPLARRRGTPWAAAAYGAFFGICAYGTYDLTNQAVLRVWTTRLTAIDMAWGAFVTATAALAGAWVDRWLRSPAERKTPTISRR